MEIQLICSKENRSILENLILARGITLSADSPVAFVEKGQPEPPCSLSVAFHPENPAALLDFLNQMEGLGIQKQTETEKHLSGIKPNPSIQASEIAPDKNPASSNQGQGHILLGRNGECFEVLKIPEIFYFRADGDYVFCRSAKGTFEVKKKLYHLQEQFLSRGFFRINKSEIVNIMKISEVVPWFGGRLLLRIDEIGEKVEVSRNYVKTFKGFLGM